MRLDSLYINGYGILNNLQLSFEEDLTVIYGLNGAGKSTLLSFFRACLYGFYTRGTVQRYEPLQGGTHGGLLNVTHQNASYAIERTVGRLSGGLLKIDNLTTGKSEPEAKIDTLLSGVSQSVFESVYAFGLRELQQLELLKNQELASHLYSVGLGSKISLAKIDQQLNSAMERIYKPRGSNPLLNAGIKEATDLRRQLVTTKEQAKEHQELANKIAEVENLISGYKATIEKLTKDIQTSRILLEVWPHWQNLVVKEAELKKFSLLDLPYNGLERVTKASNELRQLTDELEQIIVDIPQDQRGLVGKINLFELQTNFTDYNKLISSQRIAVEVAEERLRKSQLESDYLNNKVNVVKNDIAACYVGLQGTELSVRQQWLARLSELYQQQQTKPATPWLTSFLGTWGWLLVGFVFFFTEQKIATLLTGGAFLVSAVHYLIKKRDFNLGQQAKAKEIQELAVKLGVTDPATELQLVAQALQEEASLVQEKRLLLRELELKRSENEILSLEAKAKQTALDKLLQEWETILVHHSLPSQWPAEQIEVFIRASQLVPGLNERIKQCKHELELIFAPCGTKDFMEIQRLYEEQSQREQLQQEVTSSETLLENFLYQPLANVRELLQGLTKETLLQQISVAEAELLQAKSALEDNLNQLGSLNARKELLEKDQEQDQLRLELEFVKAKTTRLASEWASLKTCQWVIEQVKNRYEKERQPDLLLYATKYFSEITSGKYTRVFAPLGTQELKVEGAKGNVLDASQLSQGAVEQLYLSLRFALIACMTDQGVQLPIFVDDILVNFDHIRLEQTISLINEISKKQQIIILTCHKSLANIFAERHRRMI